MVKLSSLDEFVRVHGVLLASAGLPQVLHEQLFRKLSSEKFDGGDYFSIELCENGRQRRLFLQDEVMYKHSQVFLVDHAWSFRLPDARDQLKQHPGLMERLSAMMCLSDDAEDEEDVPVDVRSVEEVLLEAEEQAKEAGQDVHWLDLDELGINDEKFKSLELPSRFPNLIGLSLWGNKLSSKDVVLETISQLKRLKAFWINDNPVSVEFEYEFEKAVVSSLPQLEIYNSKLTVNYSKWAIAFCADVPSAKTSETGDGLKDVKVIDLSDRNILSINRKVFNRFELPYLTSLNLKGNPLSEDSKSYIIQVLKEFPNLQSLEVNIPGPVGKNAVEVLENLPNLSELNGIRAEKIMEKGENVIEGKLKQRLPEWSKEEPMEERIIRAMWFYLLTYRLCDEEKLDETSIWYIMDELGSAIRHSDEPKFRIAPFMYMPDGTLKSAISYSILWPVKDVYKGDECTRDFLFGIGEEKQRSARLTAWFHTPKDYFEQLFYDYEKKLESTRVKFNPVECPPTKSILRSENRIFTVYTDLPQVEDTLRLPQFTFCDDPAKADILWTSTQIDDDLKATFGLRDDQYVNQFPFEACIVMKHHLAKTIQKAFGKPAWVQPTYDMETEMAAFIGDYFVREKEGRNNLWIMKPWNMARTIDTSITDYIPALIRLAETGPKICQKYVEHPALYQGKKFDLRYIVLVRSFQPFEIFLSDVFWARISNHKYRLDNDSLTDYETHFTVMNYGRKLVHVNTHDFVPTFEEEHKVNWKDIHERVRQMLRSVFEGAFALHPELHSERSRAIYGVDVLLTDDFQPKLLEVTYCPDCTRACTYDMKNILGNGEVIKANEFFSDVFSCLFLNTCKNVTAL